MPGAVVARIHRPTLPRWPPCHEAECFFLPLLPSEALATVHRSGRVSIVEPWLFEPRISCESDLNTDPSPVGSNALFSRAILRCRGGQVGADIDPLQTERIPSKISPLNLASAGSHIRALLERRTRWSSQWQASRFNGTKGDPAALPTWNSRISESGQKAPTTPSPPAPRRRGFLVWPSHQVGTGFLTGL